jgi:hypothetical protein
MKRYDFEHNYIYIILKFKRKIILIKKKSIMAESNEPKSDDQLIDLFNKKLDISNDFPFLIDNQTIDFIKRSKIMFINRGLPGSGKSTLSLKIAGVYGIDNTVICSGDDFFTDEFGNYKFVREKLTEAHETARNKAITACKNEKSPIIADNTNITYWEVKSYLKIATDYNYIALVIEPRTSHKFDPEILAS